MSTTVGTEDTTVVGTVDITAVAVGTIMRVMEVIIMGVTGVIMEEEEDMVGTMVAVDMVDTMAVEDMVDTVAVAMADTTEGTDTILGVLVRAMVIDTDPSHSDTKPGEQRQEVV